MRLTAQADFYIDYYGVEKGVKYLKSLGYNQIIYMISSRTQKVFADENAYKVFQKALKHYGVNLLFTIHKEEVYNDRVQEETEIYKKKCLEALKITARMGCQMMAVRPVALRHSIPNVWEESKRLTYEIYTEIKGEADKLGVKLAFFNNTRVLQFTSGTYSYGCKATELLELAEKFDSGIVINPVYALKASERIEELVTDTKERLLAFVIYDQYQRTPDQGFPLFGAVDYVGLSSFFKNFKSDAAMVMMYTPIMNRYTDFVEDKRLIDTLTKAFHQIAYIIAGKEEP